MAMALLACHQACSQLLVSCEADLLSASLAVHGYGELALLATSLVPTHLPSATRRPLTLTAHVAHHSVLNTHGKVFTLLLSHDEMLIAVDCSWAAS